MARYRLKVEYDGTGLAGWQRQPDAPSVQQFLEEAAERFCGEPVRFFCAGRTDAGVHARGQVVHVDLPERSEFSVRQGINFHLATPQVAVVEAEQVGEDFHARFNATWRRYEYRILNRGAQPVLERDYCWHLKDMLDLEAMQAGARMLCGQHDFTSFRDSQCQAASPVKSLDAFTLRREGDFIIAHLKARSFLHHQVRIMMGSLRLLGNGRWALDDLQAALQARSRAAGGPTAPPQGLFLIEVGY